MNKYILIGVVAILIIVGGWLYFNQSSEPAVSETTQLSTTQQNTSTESNISTSQPSPATSQSAATHSYVVVGGYYEYSKDWWAAEYKGAADDWEINIGKAFVCPALEIVAGDEALIQKYTDMVKNGNTVNRLSASGRLVINMPWSLYDMDMRAKIKASTVTNPVTVNLVELSPRGTEGGPCDSFFGIETNS